MTALVQNSVVVVLHANLAHIVLIIIYDCVLFIVRNVDLWWSTNFGSFLIEKWWRVSRGVDDWLRCWYNLRCFVDNNRRILKVLEQNLRSCHSFL